MPTLEPRISFILVRSSRRTLAIEVKPDATLVVRAPKRLPEREIHRFVESHDDWIKRKRAEVLSRPILTPKEFIEGEEFLVLGQKCKLVLTNSASSKPVLAGDRLLFPEKILPIAREALTRWYRRLARGFLVERVQHFAEVMSCTPTTIRISNARRRWGSCGPTNSLNFNWRLIMAPPAIIDYVVVHELAHVMHKHHGPDFWDFVSLFCPGHKAARRWLKDNGRSLDF
jgi:predicted metal-dependent hydrolase